MADIADVVRQRADALMLSGESAAGAFPDKAVNVLRTVATQIEEWCRFEPLYVSSRLSATFFAVGECLHCTFLLSDK